MSEVVFGIDDGVISSGLRRTRDKIRAFAHKQPGWHYGSGSPPSGKQVAKASAYLALLHVFGIEETDAFPGVDGEIMITAYRNKFYFEVSFDLEEKINFSFEYDGEEVVSKENIKVHEMVVLLIDAIKQANEKECNTFGSYILNIMTPGPADSSITPSKTAAMAVAHLSSTRNVQLGGVNLYAPISSSTIPISPVTQPSSGHSIYHYSPLVAA